jgi:MFS family permease
VSSRARSRRWITRAVLGIVLATFFSDVSHEMATAVLPLYLASVGLGPAALGLIEGVADFLVSLSKLGGGLVGHRVRSKRPWASLGYLVTALGTAGLGLAGSVAALVSLRGAAWIGRGFRGPLRDHLLAEAVEPTHYGRAYGLERSGDMLGAVLGPLIAALLIALAIDVRTVLFWTLVPGLAAAGAMFFLTRGAEREPGRGSDEHHGGDPPRGSSPRPAFPRAFRLFLVGVLLFGLGDFSRTFLIWLAARGLGADGARPGGTITTAVLLYALHNLVAALAAYPVGRLGDRVSKMRLLVGGYGLGVLTNVLLAAAGGSLAGLAVAIVLSGVYISVEETLEKAVAAELLPRELRSLGFGVLATANAVGDMLSSLYVGLLLQQGTRVGAFGLAAAAGAAGVAWMAGVVLRSRNA